MEQLRQDLDTPVLIVGGGPVGLALAIDLGWRNVRTTLVERTDGSIDQPKIGVMAVRTMEFFRRWGIADRVRNGGFPADYELSQVFCTSIAGHLLAREFYPSVGAWPTFDWSPERKQRCPQMWLNPILQQAAQEFPSVDLQLRTEVESFEDRADHVVVQVRDLETGQRRTISANYLVACDGAASSIRKNLGIAMTGGGKLSHSTSILVRMEDFLERHELGQAERYIFVGPDGTWGNWTVVDGKSLWRLTLLGGLDRPEIGQGEAEAWVRRALGMDAEFEILSILSWRRSEQIADSFQKGRVFLAGDAAHTMSPTGGMGMNTGLCEAADLGWKLQAVTEGWSTPRLLDSYEAERRPIAIRNAAFSTHNFKAWQPGLDCRAILDDTPQGAELRARIRANLRESTRTDWEPWGLQMGYRYEGSPIVIADGTSNPSDDYRIYEPTARPGSRAPHVRLADGSSSLDRFGRGFTLVTLSEARESDVASISQAACEARVPLSRLALDNPESRSLYGRDLVLVRPDGHVAWRGDTCPDLQELWRRVACCRNFEEQPWAPSGNQGST